MNIFLSIRFDSPELLIWAACVGFNIAIVISYIFRGCVSKLITKLLDVNAIDSESSVTLPSINACNFLTRYLLRDNSTLCKVVKIKDGEPVLIKTAKGKSVVDYDNSKFYLDMSNEKKICSMKKGAIKWWLIPVFTLVSIILSLVIIYLLPFMSII